MASCRSSKKHNAKIFSGRGVGALGFPEFDLSGSSEQLLKAQLAHTIATSMRTAHLNIDEAARHAGASSREMSRIVDGLDRATSVFRLIEMVGRLGYDLEITVAKPSSGDPGPCDMEILSSDLRWRIWVHRRPTCPWDSSKSSDDNST